MFEKIENSPIGKPTIGNLFDLLKREAIDISPDYQRLGRIWSVEKKQLLIDSIINGYDIPKIYFHYLVSSSKELNKSNKLLAIIDGKQRIEAISDFLSDELTISENFVYFRDTSVDIKELKLSQIEKRYPLIASQILSYQLDFVFIETDERERIEDLFLRLNEGVPLNNSERRKSYGGFFVDFAFDKINNSVFFTRKVSFSNNRLEHFDLFTKLALIENSGLKSFTKKNLDLLIRENKNTNQRINDCLIKLEQNLNSISMLFNDKDELLKSKSIVPLYYIFLSQHSIDKKAGVQFLRDFHEIRRMNRNDYSIKKKNEVMIEFDRLTQQGANQKKSIEKRLRILERYFEIYCNKGSFNIETSISTAGLGLHDLQYDSNI